MIACFAELALLLRLEDNAVDSSTVFVFFPVFYQDCFFFSQVTELLIKHGANVNAMDLWQFTPLHEASSKNRIDVCSLILAHGGDPTVANCHSKSAIDLAPNR